MAKKNLLEKYNEKRDFKKTKEPVGKIPAKKKGKKLIFVVQEHHATRLHFDLRLELEGVLKSWAVPKGPSMDPSDKRLAMQTEDHPLGYEKFHGTIPEGEYGAGEMFIYDKGTWESESEDPIAAIEKGDFKFKLNGKKLKGSFVLVRTRWKDSSGKSWLLIKHKDEFVKSGEEAAVKPFASYGSRREAPTDIFKKERKTAAKKVAKVSRKPSFKKKVPSLGKDKWPEFISPQLPRLVDEPPQGEKWIHEMKFDGYRIQTHIRKDKAHFYTRKGLDWSDSFPHLLSAMENLPVDSAILDGEIVALDKQGRSNFQMLQNSIKGKFDNGLMYYAFDLLYLNGLDLRDKPLRERKALLAELLDGAPTSIKFSESFDTDAADFFQVSCENELEGIISKYPEAPYSPGRNDMWVKTKCTSRQEFVIGGWTDPQGGRTGIGALLLGIYEEGELRYAGKVGTGFNTQSLREIKDLLKPLEQEESPFKINSPKGKTIHWVKPIKVCEISFAHWTNDKILRTPVFMGMREDKSPKEIGMEKPKSIKKVTKKAARKTSSKKTSTKKAALMEVRAISSPEKVLYKQEGKTKQDVASFYQTIAPHMIPYLADRPLSLVRCPNGSEGSCFFQKHFVGNVPDSLHTFPVEEDSGEGIYSSIDSVQGLMELVQLNAFEIHAWNCHKDDYMYPDQIVMDFDPGPGVPWKTVVAAAFELKSMLDDLDLESFVKFTGGKGLHVHIPIAPLYDWDQIKSFCQTIALQMVSNNPSLYVANMAKKLRNGKIFVDYLRNGYGATAVVPYSLRAKPTSAIAMPVEWSQLKKIKGPQDFTMDKALKWIKARKRDPWEGMLKLKQKISILKPVKKSNKKAA